MNLTRQNLHEFLLVDYASKTGLRWFYYPPHHELTENERIEYMDEKSGKEAGHEMVGENRKNYWYLHVNGVIWKNTTIIKHLEKITIPDELL